jgi:hypothetical protein
MITYLSVRIVQAKNENINFRIIRTYLDSYVVKKLANVC